jgi:ribosomal protein S18 acetylase RimI-like enzyme
VNHLLHNPAYNALISGDKHLGFGTDTVRYFAEEVSPFAGFQDGYVNGFADLHQLLPAGRKILYAIPAEISTPAGWELIVHMPGVQFVYQGALLDNEFPHIVSLQEKHVPQMMELAKLTKPGPFGPKTIDFGFYHGIFDNNTLVAMTGQRMHVENYTEISAVCTHPNYTGKGYAAILLQHQLQLIQAQGKQAFLHVRADNQRAITLYERLEFVQSRPMHFYFIKRK